MNKNILLYRRYKTTTSDEYSSDEVPTTTTMISDTDDDDDYDYDSSSSSQTNESQEERNFREPRKLPKRKCFPMLKYIGFSFIVGNIILILILILVILVMKVLLIDQSKKEKKKNEYQMIYYDDIKDVVVKEYVESDSIEDFEGEFYPLKDWKNGIIVKLDHGEGELYKMCSDECKCYVECMSNMDCGNRMECNDEFKCELTDESGEKRRERLYETERKVAQVAFVIPLSICTFGLFTSIFLAEKYSKSYFEDKCSEKCPTDSVDVKAETKHYDHLDDEYHKYYCKGICKIEQLYEFQIKDNIKTGEITFEPHFNFNVGQFIDGIGYLCNSVIPEKDVYAVDVTKAKSNFLPWGHFQCQIIRLKNPEGFTKWIENKMCDLDESTVECFLKIVEETSP